MLKKLATPFVKFWNWIKETAWIQPLLIVGIVFGLIFSLSPIISWAQNLSSSSNEAVSYYNRFKYSLNGIFNDEDTSKAGKLIKDISHASNLTGDEQENYVKANLPQEKFFLSFVSEECSGCVDAKEGFTALQNNWKDGYYKPADNLDYKMVTIFTDEEVDEDTTKESGFDKLLEIYSDFFENGAANIQDTPYYIDGNISDTNLGYFQDADKENFQTPTILLIDFSETGRDGVSELMFGVAGENGEAGSHAKARTLINCWNGTGDFEIK